MPDTPSPVTEFPIFKQPRWDKVLKNKANARLWEKALAKTRNKKRILIATNVGGLAPMTPVESLVAVALTLRGYSCEFLLCDAALPACMFAEFARFPDVEGFLASTDPLRRLCETCFPPAYNAYSALGLPIHRLSEFSKPGEWEALEQEMLPMSLQEMRSFTENGMALGDDAWANALRFYAKGNIDDEPLAEPMMRRYLAAARLNARQTERLWKGRKYHALFLHHAIYVPQGSMAQFARKAKTPVRTWAITYRSGCVICSHNKTYHHTLLEEHPKDWQKVRWTEQMEQKVMAYLNSRRTGEKDWITYSQNAEHDLAALRERLKIDPAKPTFGLLTNVYWDAQLNYTSNAFANMEEWILETVRYFIQRPELQLVVRMHPAEVKAGMKSRQIMEEVIRRNFPELPGNIILVGPADPASTYVLVEGCNAAIIFATKAGLELATLGIPIIVAGEAWVRNKGFTYDASTREEYFALLDRLPFPTRLDPQQLELARRYAYHFFYRRTIPLKNMEGIEGFPPCRIAIEDLEDLLPGRDPGLDVVCDGITKGKPFIYPQERLG